MKDSMIRYREIFSHVVIDSNLGAMLCQYAFQGVLAVDHVDARNQEGCIGSNPIECD